MENKTLFSVLEEIKKLDVLNNFAITTSENGIYVRFSKFYENGSSIGVDVTFYIEDDELISDPDLSNVYYFDHNVLMQWRNFTRKWVISEKTPKIMAKNLMKLFYDYAE